MAWDVLEREDLTQQTPDDSSELSAEQILEHLERTGALDRIDAALRDMDEGRLPDGGLPAADAIARIEAAAAQ